MRSVGRSGSGPEVRSALRVERLWLCAVVAGSVLLTALTALAGAASAAAIDSEDTYARLIAATGEVSALIGRIDALAAGMADTRTDPARLQGMRIELADASGRLARLGQALRPGDQAERLGSELGAQDAEALHRLLGPAAGELSDAVAVFAEQGQRAAGPAADLTPGSLLRGDLDGEYPTLLQQSSSATAALKGAVRSERQRWLRLVILAVAGPGVSGAGAAALLLGPVAATRRRHREQTAHMARAREDAAAYVDGLLDGLDVPVVAVDADGSRITVNAAARALHGLPESGPVTLDQVLALSDLRDGAQTGPAPAGSRPLALALRGIDVQGEFVLQQGRRQVAVRARAVRAGDGRALGAVMTIQDLTELHLTNQALSRHADQLAAIGRATSAVLRGDDAGAAVCMAAQALSGAAVVSLFEPDGHGDLVCSAAHGADITGLRMPLDGRSALVRAFLEVTTLTTACMAGHPDVDHDVRSRVSELCGQEITAGAWIPVVDHGRAVAVLVLGLTTDQGLTDQLAALEIIAGEAAVALQRQYLLRRLAVEAERDGLTGAANRRVWDNELPRAVERARRTGQPLAVVLLDIDHFKDYNDEFGHPAGDALLREAVAGWLPRLRPDDVLARYGGEEFAVLLPGCNATAALAIADVLRDRMPRRRTCSAGVAVWDGVESAAGLVERADVALYAAKHAGRDRTALSDGDLRLPTPAS